MGGDFGPSVTVPAALNFIRHSDDRLLLVGRPEPIKEQIQRIKDRPDPAKYDIVPAEQVVEMDEKPADALRRKKQSSMRIAINLVKEGQADACVSAGNTGALMATSRFVLKTASGIDRPAIVTTIPALDGHFYMLDLGANVDCTGAQLHQFALMGSLLFELLEERPNPRVGLLNIGEEDIKGNEQVKTANQMLQTDLPAGFESLNYIGYVEADGIFFGGADVVVCDGFVGNVALKSMEGVAKMISGTVKAEVHRSWWLKLLGLMSKPALSGVKKRLDPGRYNGASLIGLLGTVVKSHGGADEKSFEHAVSWAAEHARHRVCQELLSRFAPNTQDGLSAQDMAVKA